MQNSNQNSLAEGVQSASNTATANSALLQNIQVAQNPDDSNLSQTQIPSATSTSMNNMSNINTSLLNQQLANVNMNTLNSALSSNNGGSSNVAGSSAYSNYPNNSAVLNSYSSGGAGNFGNVNSGNPYLGYGSNQVSWFWVGSNFWQK